MISRACFARNIPEQAIGRGVAFVTVIAAVHAAGVFCYSHQTKQPGNRGSQDDRANVRDPLDDWIISLKATNVASSAIDLRYRSALKAAFFEQTISLLITSTILDGGGIFRIA